MRGNSHVRFGERGEEIPVEKSMNGVLAPTLPDPSPSPEDVTLTRAIVQAGKLLDVAVQDHLVIGLSNWVSLREKGLGFS